MNGRTSPFTARPPPVDVGLLRPSGEDERTRDEIEAPAHRRRTRRGCAPPELSWRVLLVEDDASAAGALRAVLTRRGWDVTIAATVADALERLDRKPHCLVLDLMLPDGSGLDVLERLRAAGQPLRVIVTTGADDAALLKRVRQYEPDAILRKPIDLSELLHALGPCRREEEP